LAGEAVAALADQQAKTTFETDKPNGANASHLVYWALWVITFGLIFTIITVQDSNVTENADKLSNIIRRYVEQVQRNVDQVQRSSDVAHIADFERNVTDLGEESFGRHEVPEQYYAYLRAAVRDIENRHFSRDRGLTFARDLRQVYLDHRRATNEVLRRGLDSLYIFIYIVVMYQIIVTGIYLLLELSGPTKWNDLTLFTEGAFNAIDLGILATVTAVYFDRDSKLINTVIFLSYAFHVLYFARFILVADRRGAFIDNRRKFAAVATYLIALLMPMVMAAIHIESRQYFITGFSMIIILLVAAAPIIWILFGKAPRLGPDSSLGQAVTQ
jgi:hypothetical protein